MGVELFYAHSLSHQNLHNYLLRGTIPPHHAGGLGTEYKAAERR